MKLHNLSIKAKLQITICLAAFIMLMTGIFNLNVQQQQQLTERHYKLQAQVDTAASLIEHYRHQSHLPIEQAQQEAKQALAALRYDTDNYFWVTSKTNELILHPLRPNAIGQDMTNIRDGAGKFHWQEMSQIATTTTSGFLDYTWLSPAGEMLDKISYVHYIPEWDWIIGSGLFVSDIQQDFFGNIVQQGIITFLSVSVLCLVSIVVGNSIVKPIEQLLVNLNLIAKGDLTQELALERHDEVGKLSRGLCQMQSTIKDALILAQSTADKAGELSENIASTSEETAQSLASQNIQLEQFSSAMSEMSATINDVALNAERTSIKTAEVSSQAQNSSHSMSSTVEDVHAISLSVDETTQLMTSLKNGVDNISEVVQVINNVSEQTNLLALNAAIEAARAGEQGRGFAVVADEVRNLASRTQQSTSQVQQTIDELLNKTAEVVALMQNNNQSVAESVTTATTTKNTLDSMVNELNGVNDMVAQIAAAAEQQGIVSNEMNQNVSTVHLSAAEINQASEHLAHQTQAMANAAEELKAQLTYFKLA